MYTKAEAQHAIQAEWRSLPEAERKTRDQAALFAMRIKDKYRFRAKADGYQIIKGWLQSRLAP